MTNLIKKLRKAAKFGGHYNAAADAIEERDARIAELEMQLRSMDGCNMCNWIERAECVRRHEEKDAEIARLNADCNKWREGYNKRTTEAQRYQGALEPVEAMYHDHHKYPQLQLPDMQYYRLLRIREALNDG